MMSRVDESSSLSLPLVLMDVPVGVPVVCGDVRCCGAVLVSPLQVFQASSWDLKSPRQMCLERGCGPAGPYA
jgi:hypothetical protein